MARTLRSVPPGETPDAQAARAEKKKAPKSVVEAASTGTFLDLQEALRDVLAASIMAGPPPRDLAALTRRLQEVVKEIESERLRLKQEAEDDRGATEDEEWDASAI